MCKLCACKLCVCVCKLCVRQREARRREADGGGTDGMQNRKQEPHTKIRGTTEDNDNKLQKLSAFGNEEPSHFRLDLFGSAHFWVESVRLWRINFRQNRKQIPLDIREL